MTIAPVLNHNKYTRVLSHSILLHNYKQLKNSKKKKVEKKKDEFNILKPKEKRPSSCNYALWNKQPAEQF